MLKKISNRSGVWKIESYPGFYECLMGLRNDGLIQEMGENLSHNEYILTQKGREFLNERK